MHGVVASIGGWWQSGALSDIDVVKWEKVTGSSLTSYCVVARTYFPLLHGTEAAFFQILGGAADHPIPNSGPISVTAAGVKSLGSVLEAKQPASAPRIRQIQINVLVATGGAGRSDSYQVTASAIGAFAADLNSGSFEPEDDLGVPIQFTWKG